MEKIRICDQRGRERGWDWLVARFGDVKVDRAEPTAGETSVFRIVQLKDAAGPAVQVVNVADQDGNPLDGIVVVRHWPDAPGLPAWSPPVSMWHQRGVFGKTNANGDIGFGMGHGDYYFAPQNGVSSVWVADDTGPSDRIRGLGMVGGSNHRHLDVYYQLEEVVVAPPSEPVEGPPDQPPDAPIEEPPAEPVVQPPEQPAEPVVEEPTIEGVPEEPSTDRWQELVQKLDLIISLLEERVE